MGGLIIKLLGKEKYSNTETFFGNSLIILPSIVELKMKGYFRRAWREKNSCIGRVKSIIAINKKNREHFGRLGINRETKGSVPE